MECNEDTYLFSEDGKQLCFDIIDEQLDLLNSSEKRLEYLKKTLFENMNKNRFFIQNERTKKVCFQIILQIKKRSADFALLW